MSLSVPVQVLACGDAVHASPCILRVLFAVEQARLTSSQAWQSQVPEPLLQTRREQSGHPTRMHSRSRADHSALASITWINMLRAMLLPRC